MPSRERDPIIGTFSDLEKIKCKDCIYRDKRLVLGKDTGARKAWCEIYTKEDGISKPTEILFKNADCEFYKKEN